MKVRSLSRVRLLATSWTAAYQAPPSMGFSRQEYWSGVPLPSPMECLVVQIIYFSNYCECFGYPLFRCIIPTQILGIQFVVLSSQNEHTSPLSTQKKIRIFWYQKSCLCLLSIIICFHWISLLSWVIFSSVQSLSHVHLFATPCTAACQASLSITNSWSLLKLMSIESVMPSDRLILCRPLLLLPPIPPSIRVSSNESTLRMRWPKYWSFSFSISPSNEHPGLISFRMDWLYLLAVQGTLKSLLQHHSSKASVIRHLAFFTVHSHIHTWPLEKP